MLRPFVAAVLAALLLAAPGERSPADEPKSDPLAEARTRLERDDSAGAVALLESALPGCDAATRPKLIETLRTAYDRAARQAEADGRTREAEAYRENLAILGPPSPEGPESAPMPTPPSPAPSDTKPEFEVPPAAEGSPKPEAPSGEALPNPAPQIDPIPPADTKASSGQEGGGSALDPGALPAGLGDIAPPAPAEPADPGADDPVAATLARADEAFLARKYPDAGILYAQLARDGHLPEDRRDAWAYCRRFEVVRRINGQPRTSQEWAAIAAEIARIRKLCLQPNWYDEYLTRLVRERSAGAPRGPARPVLRGASPEEHRPTPTKPKTPPQPAPRSAPPAEARSASSSVPLELPFATDAAAAKPEPARAQEPAPPPRQPAPAPKVVEASAPRETPAARATPPQTPPSFRDPDLARWQVLDSANFRIYHADPELARRVSQAAENAREELIRRWTGQPPRGQWTPVCEVYLYPDARVFSQRTGQPEDSPGFSTSGLMAGRVTARRINLRADHPKLTEAILPHEVTHIVLAELFPERQIPRWADEGMAVLSEPTGEQSLRASDLAKPLDGGKIFSVQQLMVMDYPEGQYWPLYYAQSISLTRFLVEQGTPTRFVEFIRDSQAHGAEAALLRHYQIKGFADLQGRWLSFARTSTASAVQTAEASEPSTTR